MRALVQEGVAPDRILCISFTKAAVDEMRGRLGDLEGVELRTLHALAYRICEEHFGRRDVINMVGPRDRKPTRRQLVREILERLGAPQRRWRTAQRGGLDPWMEAIKAYRQTVRMPDLEEVPMNGLGSAEQEFRRVHAEFERVMARRGLIDFDGLVLDAVGLLASDPLRRARWAARWDHVLVDEFQDLPAAKMTLLRLLVCPARSLFAVGDEDQTIYGFAGATTGTIRRLRADWPDMREVVLARNYRCPHELVVRSRWLIDRNRLRTPKDLRR